MGTVLPLIVAAFVANPYANPLANVSTCLHVNLVGQVSCGTLLDRGVFLVVVLHVQVESLGKVAKIQQASAAQSIAVDISSKTASETA